MTDDPGATVSYKHLIRLEKRGIDVYLPGESEKEYKVKDLWEQSRTAMPRKKKY